MDILFLGTGTSYGIPMIGCTCDVCVSDAPENKRLRSSVIVSYNGKNILIDTPPDLRTQMLMYNIQHIDAVLFTHHHADHVFGLDDIRIYNKIQKSPISCYASERTFSVLKKSFDYIFDPATPRGGGIPELTFTIIDKPFHLFDEMITPVPVLHGDLPILGFRWNKFAYITDCSVMPEDSLTLLTGLDVLVLNGLRYRPHITHYSIEQAVEIIKRVNPGKAYLTHISHDVDHNNLKIELPRTIELAYDGLKIAV